MKPLFVINLKTYQQGKKAVELAKRIDKTSKKQKKVKIILGVQASDIYEISKATKLEIYAQHVDYVKPGRHTGFILPEAVKSDGAKGTFLNHSEHKINLRTIKKSIERCKEVKLKTLVFASSLKEAKKISKWNPDYIAYEPPELVAGNVSVSKAKPEIIKKLAKRINTNLLIGAGIKTKNDFETSLKLGAKGIAISSAITKARNPEKRLKEFLDI